MNKIKRTVIIIGVGNLGLRHFESLVVSGMNLHIILLDPNDKSLKRAKNHLKCLDFNKELISVKLINDFKNVLDFIDIAVIATNSNVRLDVLNKLISASKIKFLILEKVLFQKLEDYEKCYSLLQDNNVKCYVNCPMRTYDIFENIKSFIDNSLKLEIYVEGGDWSLGCNSIHYIDLFSFLSNSTVDYCTLNLDKEIIESKRKGFIEFTGSMELGYRNNSLNLSSISKSSDSKLIKIMSGKNLFMIDENSGICEHYVENEKINEYGFRYPYQSEITKNFVKELFETNDCKLPKYLNSMKLHKILISELINHVRINFNKNTNVINIT
tara:strand:+ start:322 stop:1299 length:978 start_codon:yes stop_codon:yes gene_type:complete